MEEGKEVTVEVKNLRFVYPGLDGHPPPGLQPVVEDFSLKLRAGDRCLLIGANGAGKTTILRIIGGQHMMEPGMVRVLGRSPFHDTTLVSSGCLSYLGGEWRRDVAFAGFDVPLQMDVSAEKLIFGVQGINEERRHRLIKVLDINLSWRMHKVSDGERRRVQICMGLLYPYKVLLLDEITVNLDVLARADLFSFLLSESEERGATIIYATHIFDGLDRWPTHIAFLAQRRLQFLKQLKEIEDVKELSLMRAVEKWLRKDIEERKSWQKMRQNKGDQKQPKGEVAQVEGASSIKIQVLNNGWAGGRLHSTLAGENPFDLSSNRVLRQ